MEISMALANIDLQMVNLIKAIFKMEFNQAMLKFIIQIHMIFIKEMPKMELNKEKELCNMKTVLFMMVIGKMMFKLDMANINFQMEKYMKVKS